MDGTTHDRQQTDIATYRLNWLRGRLIKMCADHDYQNFMNNGHWTLVKPEWTWGRTCGVKTVSVVTTHWASWPGLTSSGWWRARENSSDWLNILRFKSAMSIINSEEHLKEVSGVQKRLGEAWGHLIQESKRGLGKLGDTLFRGPKEAWGSLGTPYFISLSYICINLLKNVDLT